MRLKRKEQIMKNNSHITFPAIRDTFICLASLADYLGRSMTYCSECMNGKKEFSKAEKIAISVAVGQPWEVIASV